MKKGKRNQALRKVLPKGVRKMLAPGIKKGAGKRSQHFHAKTHDVLDEQRHVDDERDRLATTGENEESYQRARGALGQLTGWDLEDKEGEVNDEAFKVDSVLKRFGRAKIGKT